jgi:hypothetical protein
MQKQINGSIEPALARAGQLPVPKTWRSYEVDRIRHTQAAP